VGASLVVTAAVALTGDGLTGTEAPFGKELTVVLGSMRAVEF